MLYKRTRLRLLVKKSFFGQNFYPHGVGNSDDFSADFHRLDLLHTPVLRFLMEQIEPKKIPISSLCSILILGFSEVISKKKLNPDQSGNEDGRVYIYSPERQKIQVHDTRHVLSRLSDNDGTLSSTSFPRGSSASPSISDVADSGSIQSGVATYSYIGQFGHFSKVYQSHKL